MEIAKCPICNGVPLDKWEITSVRAIQTGQMCCGVDCNTNERWNQYAAAMELAKALLAEDAQEARMIDGDFNDMLAMTDADKKLAELGRVVDEKAKHVLEVFKCPTT